MINTDYKTLTPSFLVYFNGARLPIEQEASIKKITVIDRLDAASTFIIEMANIDKEWIEDEELFIGSEVKIHMGYKNDMEQIIFGEITGIAAEFERNFVCNLIIKGRDHLHRLYRRITTRAFYDMTDEEIIKKVVSDAQLSCDVDHIGYENVFTMQKDQSDFHYLLGLAEKFDCNLWVRDKKLYFKRQHRNEGEDVILEHGKTLIEFCPILDTTKIITEVEVRSWDSSKWKAIVGSATSDDITESDGGKIVRKNFGDQKTVHIDSSIIDEKSADDLAICLLTQNARQYITGYGKCQGHTKIRAGSIIKIVEESKKYSNKYFVQSACHVLNTAGGYTTYFDFITCIGAANAGETSTFFDNIEYYREPERKDRFIEKQLERIRNQKHPEINNLKWMKDGQEVNKVHVGDTVKMTVTVKEIDDKMWLRFIIYEKDYKKENDYIARKPIQIEDGKAELEWQVEYHEDTDDINSAQEQEEKGYTLPEYIFIADSTQPEAESGESPVLEVKGWMKTKLINKEANKILTTTNYILHYPDRSTEEGTTDKDGYIEMEDLKLGKYYISLKEDEEENE